MTARTCPGLPMDATLRATLAYLAAERASRHIHRFEELRPGDRVFLVTCVSWRDRNRNHRDQEAKLRRHVEAIGAIVVGVEDYTGPRYDAYYLLKARIAAEKVGARWLLAETTDRFCRHRQFHPQLRWNLQATEDQLRELANMAGKLKLMTHLDPDAKASEASSCKIKRGQSAKGNKGGGSKKKGYGPRYDQLPKSIEVELRGLYVAGRSVRKIGRHLKLPKSTVHRWVSQFGPYWKRCAARMG